ncbi:hypothetical protein PIB30_056058 [Stylosanthes scabra]|uniref:Uncharacterized protein n=1 Tax=Stylosanthes scabra TaxID=79078 RepID=A0ABU6ZHY1_9FABA|nr:hypothetical protein [Stylosanthes scabra]
MQPAKGDNTDEMKIGILNTAIAVVVLLQGFQTWQQAQCWVQVGYWYYNSGFPISHINVALYTHLVYAFADVNSSTSELSVSADDHRSFSHFTATVKNNNPSLSTLLSIGGSRANISLEVLSSMIRKPSSRNSFIQSSIRIARLYGFQGLDLAWLPINSSVHMYYIGMLFQEWRAAAKSEATNSTNPELIITAFVEYKPGYSFSYYPVESIQDNLNWVLVSAFSYHTPQREPNFTAAPAALYDPSSQLNTDSAIKQWLDSGIASTKLVLMLPFFGFAWKLRNPRDSAIGAAAAGPATNDSTGFMTYKGIKDYIQGHGGTTITYNATYVVNYCSIGSTWIGFDDVDAVKTKVSYAREKNLLGYAVWELSYDHNWVLSTAAAQQALSGHDGWRYSGRSVIILIATVWCSLLLGVMIYYFWKRIFESKGLKKAAKDAGDFQGSVSVPDIRVFSLSEIKLATKRFSIENKLGQGGYGPVYKGVLRDGKEVALKMLAKTSTQGFEEFKNEITLTARLQHVNLVRLLGFYIDKDEHMLIYEFMPNKSLDYYLFGQILSQLKMFHD